MREIKFRVWDNGIMKKFIRRCFYVDCEGNLYKDNDPYGLDMSGKRNISPLINCVIMQFTGMKDKNGVDIYEGDIIRFDLLEGLGQPPRYGLKREVKITPYGAIGQWDTNIKVVGNIYEGSKE